MEAVDMTHETKSLQFSEQGDSLHSQVNQMVSKEYARHFKCKLKHFMPQSFSLVESNNLLACTGLRSAAKEKLFLEQYMDQSIEIVLSSAFDISIDRKEIVEIGGFALTDSSHALSFMFQLAPAFAKLGYNYAVCTVTDPVRKYLKKLGLDTINLGDADPKKVDTSDDAWGSYYKLKPVILAGDINAAVKKIEPFRRFLTS